MCGFLVYKEKGNNFFIKRRGQDHTNKIKRHGLTFEHHLLSITGEFAPQPYEDKKEDIVAIYNGEIYNHKFKKSDGENIIPLYKKYGEEFPSYLDGEWAIALYDFKKGIAIFTTDLFATKPIWRKGLEVASYESGIGGEKIKANTIEIIKFDVNILSQTEIKRKVVYQFDLNQYKNTYDDWIAAFERAVKKRSTKDCFIGLSSGYDSGAIACTLEKQRQTYKAYIIEGREQKKILEQRMLCIHNYNYIGKDQDFKKEQEWLNRNVEEFRYNLPTKKGIHQDSAALGLSMICSLAHSEGRKVYLSGQGADEIISDYSLMPYQSTFKGKFPEKLKIWKNFYDGCQCAYLGKEEYVAGSHSVETRYPFLDKDVVQEFLWLTPELKNKNYKAPIHDYLKRNNFPFDEEKKIGLRVRV